MKRSFFAAALLLSAGGAAAADLPYSPGVPMIAATPQYTWTGIYAGVHLGYGRGDVDRPGASGGDADGVLGGAQVGANVQWGNVVASIETDISGTGIEGTDSTPGGVTIMHADLDYFGTLRGRVGFAFDRFLVYGTGGLAYAGFDNRLQVLGVNASDAGTQIGWTAGGGVEAAITLNWSVKVEYLYADMGRQTYRFRNPAGVSADERVSYDQSLVRAGVNYRF